mmetsp:Transcript_35450/g.97898  ORF Transcript_35450/g.97898 Transcript_35450/m.97898 type:complete len:209 (+) Transcript_35450:383-1009(+)
MLGEATRSPALATESCNGLRTRVGEAPPLAAIDDVGVPRSDATLPANTAHPLTDGCGVPAATLISAMWADLDSFGFLGEAATDADCEGLGDLEEIARNWNLSPSGGPTSATSAPSAAEPGDGLRRATLGAFACTFRDAPMEAPKDVGALTKLAGGELAMRCTVVDAGVCHPRFAAQAPEEAEPIPDCTGMPTLAQPGDPLSENAQDLS